MLEIYLSPPHMSPDERRLMLEAFDSNWIAPLGPHVDGFERELAAYVDIPHAVALSSGTAALHLALLNEGVEAGDVVLVQSFTFAATANAVTYVGAEPVFVDSDDTWCLDPDALAEAIRTERAAGRRVAAVISVDLYGGMPDYARVEAVCAEAEVPLVEDAAEALGSRLGGRHAGTFGNASIFSFNGNKILTTSGGGMYVSADADRVKRARYLATQAREPVVHYEHTSIGFNYRLSNLLAAVGRGQLMHLDERVEARRANRRHYGALLGDLQLDFMPERPSLRSNCWLTCLTLPSQDHREAMRLALATERIESRPLWKPMHLQPVFAESRHYGGDVSADLFERGLCLPSGSALTAEQRERIGRIAREAYLGV